MEYSQGTYNTGHTGARLSLALYFVYPLSENALLLQFLVQLAVLLLLSP